jgi:nifR3 family TIM-barrel protein
MENNPLTRPLAIGGRAIAGRLFLAPMAVLGNVAFRQLVAEFGGFGLLFSEMCSAGRIPHENPQTSTCFRWRAEELPHLVCQIVGGDPVVMARAAGVIEEVGFFGVDINFGCSVSAICRRNCGAALLKQPEAASAVVAAVRRAVSVPLFVKFRTGWHDDSAAAVAMARRFEDAGADALTFHPRTAPDRRTRPPKWEYIGRVKQAVSIPVIGNGNVFSRADCLRMLGTTGCDGVAVGRMAVARPWSFADWVRGGETEPADYLRTALRLAELLEKHFDPIRALRRFKRFALYFSANFRYGHQLHTRLQNAADMSVARNALQDFFRDGPEATAHPNMNRFH